MYSVIIVTIDMDKRAPDPRKALVAFDIIVHVLLGVYGWEWFVSLDFDWQFISGKSRFQWPMIFYFLNRYIMLFSIIGVIIGVDITSPIKCQPLYTYNVLFGASTIGLASINLSIRTMAVWGMRWYIVTPLVVIILGHFAILLHVVTIKAAWITGVGCALTYSDGGMLMAAFIYTMIFDFIILSLMAFKLFKTTIGSPSRLRKLIFRDGLIYFLLVFLANAVATIVISLDLSPVTSVIANIPAATLSTIVACRVVRRLKTFLSSAPETITVPTHCSTVAFQSFRHPNFSATRDGIHVEAFPSEDKFTVAKDDSYDPESQDTHGPAKVPPS